MPAFSTTTSDTSTGGALLPHQQHRNRTIEEYFETGSIEEHDAIVQDIAGRIDLGVYTTSELVHDVRPFVTENAPLPQVASALGLIAEILGRLQIPLARGDIHAFAEYLLNRLVNSGSEIQYRAGIQQSVEALIHLVNMIKFPVSDTSEIAKGVFSVNTNGVLRDLKAVGRLSLFKLLALLVEKHAAILKRDMGGNEFAKGIVTMAEFEKDPSCLRILFGLYQEFGKNWVLDDDTYLLIWESYIRYFPITLAKAPTDPNVPKPDELRALLVSCFISNDFYAPEAFSRLIDMLDTNQDLSANTKKDVFDTMVACISGYGFAVVLDWAPKLWESIKFEIWNGENEEFISSSLKVINALGKKLSTKIQDWDDELNTVAQFVIGILKECTEKILDSKQRFMLSTGRIIHALSCASLYMFSWLPKKVLPSLLTLWDDLNLKSEKTSLLDVFNRGLQARNDVEAQLMADFKAKILDQATITYCIEGGKKILKSLTHFKERLVEVYWTALKESATDAQDFPAFRINTIQGLASLMKFQEFLNDSDRGTITEALNSIVLTPDQQEDILDAAIMALRQISMADPERFRTITLANSIAKITDTTDQQEIIRILDPLIQIACTSPCTFEAKTELNPKFMVFNAYQQCLLGLISEAKLETQISRISTLLGAILRGLELFDAALKNYDAAAISESTTHPYFFIIHNLFTRLIGVRGEGSSAYVGILVDIGKLNEDKDPVELYQVLSLLGDITTLALRSSQTTAGNNFLIGPGYTGPSRIWTLFCDVDNKIQSLGKFQMNVQKGPQDKCLAMILSKSLLAGVRRENKNRLGFYVGEAAKAMVQNVTLGDSNSSPYSRVASLQFLQLLVNKFAASAEILESEGGVTFSAYLEALVQATGPNTDKTHAQRVYQVLAYHTTAALARCDQKDRVFVRLMLEGIAKPKIGNRVAQSFRMLLAPSNVLDKENFAIVRPLRQGRLYAYVIDDLIALWRTSTDSGIKSNYLVAFVAVLNFLEPSVYLENSEAIFPLLLEGTNVQNDDWTKLACISCIRTLLPLRPKTITSHLDSVISRMTDRTRNTYFSPSDSNVQCRAAAIDVLSLLTKHIDTNELQKRKNKVLIELDIAVDDMSMTVRDRAQRCKLAWFTLVIDS